MSSLVDPGRRRQTVNMNESAAPFARQVFRFRPRLVDALKGYSRAKFLADLAAGLTVGVVALSLCVGLGIASGVLDSGSKCDISGG